MARLLEMDIMNTVAREVVLMNLLPMRVPEERARRVPDMEAVSRHHLLRFQLSF